MSSDGGEIFRAVIEGADAISSPHPHLEPLGSFALRASVYAYIVLRAL